MRGKTIMSVALCLALCFGCLFSQTQAKDAGDTADVRLSVSQTQIFEGDALAVTVTLGSTLQDVVSFDWLLRFDGTLFTLQSASIGTCNPDMRVSNPKSDADGAYYSISYVDKTSQGGTLTAGTVCTLTFIAAEGLAADRTGTFSLVSEGVYDTGFAGMNVSAGEAVAVGVRRVLPEKLVADKLPDKMSYIYREALDTTGLALSLVYNNGRTEPVTDGFVCTPSAFTVQSGLPLFGLRGNIPVTVLYAGLQTTFTVQVRLTAWQWLVKIVLFGWLWY